MRLTKPHYTHNSHKQILTKPHQHKQDLSQSQNSHAPNNSLTLTKQQTLKHITTSNLSTPKVHQTTLQRNPLMFFYKSSPLPI